MLVSIIANVIVSSCDANYLDVGLTAHIINRGLTDTPTKTYKFDAKDGFITS